MRSDSQHILTTKKLLLSISYYYLLDGKNHPSRKNQWRDNKF